MLQPSAEPHGVAIPSSSAGVCKAPRKLCFSLLGSDSCKTGRKKPNEMTVTVCKATTIHCQGHAALCSSRAGLSAQQCCSFSRRPWVSRALSLKRKGKKQAQHRAADLSDRKEIWWFISVCRLLGGAKQTLPRTDSGDSPSANNGTRGQQHPSQQEKAHKISQWELTESLWCGSFPPGPMQKQSP